MSEEFIVLSLMEEYGWTYEEYLAQPSWIIQYAIAKNQVEYQVNKSNGK